MGMVVAVIVVAMVIMPVGIVAVRIVFSVGRKLLDVLVHSYLTLSKTISASNNGK